MMSNIKSKWDDLEVGEERSFETVFTDHMVDEFSHLIGDKNPLHMDSEFAKARGFKGRVVHGMLVASTFSRLFGEDFLADDNLYLSQSLFWKKPAIVGEKLIISGKIEAKIESVKTLEVKTRIVSESGEELVFGKALIKSLV